MVLMMNHDILFNKSETVTQQDKINAYKKHLAHAHHALDQFEYDIQERQKKLQSLFIFIEKKKTLYQQLKQKYEQDPSPAHSASLDAFKKEINDFLAEFKRK